MYELEIYFSNVLLEKILADSQKEMEKIVVREGYEYIFSLDWERKEIHNKIFMIAKGKQNDIYAISKVA